MVFGLNNQRYPYMLQRNDSDKVCEVSYLDHSRNNDSSGGVQDRSESIKSFIERNYQKFNRKGKEHNRQKFGSMSLMVSRNENGSFSKAKRKSIFIDEKDP